MYFLPFFNVWVFCLHVTPVYYAQRPEEGIVSKGIRLQTTAGGHVGAGNLVMVE